MTIYDLANISHVTERTIRKNITNIKGISTFTPNITFIPGTRYIYNVRKTKLDTTEKRKLTLLKATDAMRYVDNDMLCMSEESFATMIDSLLTVGMIRKNGSNNPYGANAYDVTDVYGQFIRENKNKKFEEAAKCLGIFCGKAIDALNS